MRSPFGGGQSNTADKDNQDLQRSYNSAPFFFSSSVKPFTDNPAKTHRLEEMISIKVATVVLRMLRSPDVAHDDGPPLQVLDPEDVQHGPSFGLSFNFYLKKKQQTHEFSLVHFSARCFAVESPCRETPERPPFR